MFPPDVTDIDRILWSLLATFQMAIAGVVLGLIFSLPIAILAADGLSPHPAVKQAARGVIALFRTVPDLVWALIFVITVGLGVTIRRRPHWAAGVLRDGREWC
jgi:phosphonate transport system permease protein